MAQPVIELFQAQVARTPDTTALVVGDRALSYRELEQASAALAGRLVENGVRPGRTVCLYLNQSADTVVGMLAALRTGASWAVIEPHHPLSRIRALLADSDCAAIVHSGADTAASDTPLWTALAASGDGPRLVDIDVPEQATTSAVPVHEDACAYLIFTSGTTGTPKAVMVSRGQLATAVAARNAWARGGRPVFLVVMSMSFDGALGDLFWTLGQGGTAVFPDRRQLPNPVEVARLAREHAATHTFVVPSFYRLLLDHARSLTSLTLAIVGGEVCTRELAKRHQEKLPATELVNIYGPTETVVSCTAHRVDASAPTVPIGKPCPGARALVLDERLQPVPTGTTGELYIGGFVAMGYAARPALTAERFVADPTGHGPGERLYRTGDLASVNERGELEFHGRVDHQVKIRGNRVELGEIEHVLEEHPAVRQVVAVFGHGQLVAFLVADTTGADRPSTLVLREFCRAHLVEHAIPERFEWIDRLPVTATGKADRAALAARISAGSPVDAPGHEEWSSVQNTVAAAWTAVLGHAESGLRDNFFVVGGTSLKLIDLFERLEETWPGAINIAELFDLPTIEKQAEVITRSQGGAGGRDEQAIPRRFEV